MLEFLNDLLLGKPIWMWTIFIGAVLGLLVLDLGLLHRKARAIGVAESLWMSSFYIAAALASKAFLPVKLMLTTSWDHRCRRQTPRRSDGRSLANQHRHFAALP
jgi:hypothetical protein